MTIIPQIRKQQQALAKRPLHMPPHNPSVLLVACVDARKDIEGIGFNEDDTSLMRNISATVVRNDGSPESREQERALREAIGNGIKHIVVMGHTNCGGMEACLCGHDHALPAVHKHLQQYQPIRADIIAEHGDPNKHIEAGGSIDAMGSEMAQRSVRMSVENLMTYDVVRDAVKEGLQIHGWVINTGSGIIREWDEEAGHFHRMAPPEYADVSDVINRVRSRQSYIKGPEDMPPPPHNPTMLLMGDMAGPITLDTLNIPYGEALIYRDRDPCGADLTTPQEAALQFAINAKAVKDVVVMLHTDSSRYKGADQIAERGKKETALRVGIKKLKDYFTEHWVEDNKVKLHGWLIDTSTHLIDEMDLRTGAFRPMAAVAAETGLPEASNGRT